MPGVVPLSSWRSVCGPLLDRPLEVLDVGCRWGPAESWLALSPYARVTGFDPDPQECLALEDKFRGNHLLRFVPLGLGSSTGKGVLHVAQEKACSSVYPPDLEAIERHPELAVASPGGSQNIDLVRLDEWLESDGSPPVDFIKLDTQGSELEILRGAGDTLQSVLGIQTEVQFNPIYKDVPLFSDVDRYLRSRGFILWRLENLAHYGLASGISDYPHPAIQHFDSSASSFEGKGGRLFWADAFYLRDTVYGGAEHDWQQLLRQALISAALGLHDVAQMSVLSAENVSPSGVAAKLQSLFTADSRYTLPGHQPEGNHPLLQTLPKTADDPLLEGWYHTIELGNGLVSNGHFDHRSIVDRYGLPESLQGKSALDVGTGDGFFAFEMERRGAGPVTALDVRSLEDCDWVPRMRRLLPAEVMKSTSWGDHFNMAKTLLGSNVERVVCSVYDLSPERVGAFDVVFCGDLLLHLQNPLLALSNIRSVTKEMAIVETVMDPFLDEQFPDQAYVRFGAREAETEPGKENTFWRLNRKAFEDMLIYADFARTELRGIFHLPPHGVPVMSMAAYVS